MKLVAVGVMAAAGIAHAEAPAEVTALHALFRNVTWAGKTVVPRGAMPKSTNGRSTCRWFLDDSAVACEMEETGLGPKAWHGLLTVGWDADAKEYRALLVDGSGSAGVLTGRLDGGKLALTSALRATLDGKASRFRLSWAPGDAGTIHFTEELSLGTGAFTVSEEATMKPQ